MIGLSLLLSVSKHNMWSYYHWVVVVVVHLYTQYVVVLWLGCRCCRPSVNTICGRIMIGLSLLSSVSKHNMWSYYDWVYSLPSVNTICGRIMIGLSLSSSVNTICGLIMIGLSLSSVSKHNMWSYYDWDVIVLTRPHIVFIDGRQWQPNHNTTTYYVYWRTTTTTQS
jgi:hypothetical protein